MTKNPKLLRERVWLRKVNWLRIISSSADEINRKNLHLQRRAALVRFVRRLERYGLLNEHKERIKLEPMVTSDDRYRESFGLEFSTTYPVSGEYWGAYQMMKLKGLV